MRLRPSRRIPCSELKISKLVESGEFARLQSKRPPSHSKGTEFQRSTKMPAIGRFFFPSDLHQTKVPLPWRPNRHSESLRGQASGHSINLTPPCESAQASTYGLIRRATRANFMIFLAPLSFRALSDP